MKKFLLSAVGVLVMNVMVAQTNEVNKITASLNSGNSSGVSELFLANIDLSVDGNDDVYSKAQAAQILKSFFDRNPALKFGINHEGSSRTNDIYRIGTLTTKTGSFRVTFFLKNENGRYLVKELRIEKAAGL
ncbi:MAG: DUF4783 domain-containing protein [Bacteroidota bacterium]